MLIFLFALMTTTSQSRSVTLPSYTNIFRFMDLSTTWIVSSKVGISPAGDEFVKLLTLEEKNATNQMGNRTGSASANFALTFIQPVQMIGS